MGVGERGYTNHSGYLFWCGGKKYQVAQASLKIPFGVEGIALNTFMYVCVCIDLCLYAHMHVHAHVNQKSTLVVVPKEISSLFLRQASHWDLRLASSAHVGVLVSALLL